MELRHLRYFVAAATELNISRAAKHLHVSQPPLSRQIHDLEAEIGAPLFDRSKKRLSLTPAGECFLKEAKSILTQAMRAVQLANGASRGETGRFNIALLSYTGDLLLARAMRAVRKRFPLVDMNIFELTPQKQIDALIDGEIDIGFVGKSALEWKKELEFEPIRQAEMMIALPPGHPLTKLGQVSIGKLAKEPFVFFKRSSGPAMHDWMMELCRSAGFDPIVAKFSDQPQTFLEFVGAGFGVAFLPDWFQRYPSDAVFRSLAPRFEIQLFMTWRRDNTSPILHAFTKMLKRP